MSSSLLRELRADDADAVAALFVSAFGASRQVDAEEIRTWLDNTEFEPDWFRVLEEDGRVVGYGDVWPRDDDIQLDVAAPGRWETFLEWAETEGRKRGVSLVKAEPPAGHELARVCEARGYRYAHSSFTMEIELTEPPVANVPQGFELTDYREHDQDAVIAALNESFAGDRMWHGLTASNFREFYLRARGFDPHLWTLAWDGDELAGAALAYFQRGSDDTRGWVGTLGVRALWRRRGLGEGLLRTAFSKLYARGLTRVGLGVDAENVAGALRLYERAGMHKAGQIDEWVLDL
jgi:mycothiol synthase